jgi:hypothetical protein
MPCEHDMNRSRHRHNELGEARERVATLLGDGAASSLSPGRLVLAGNYSMTASTSLSLRNSSSSSSTLNSVPA